jgi:triosephosphate isomerase
MRKPILAGNWKMYKTPRETADFFAKFLPLVAAADHCEIVIAPPFVDIPAAVEAARGSRVGIGGQNLDPHAEGAYTGEVSGPMLAAAGCRWVIVGHSERRQYFGETDATVLARTRAALAAGLSPIVCVLAPLAAAEFARLVIAYEPVWAIGTGRTATPEIAADAHRALRALIAARHGAAAAQAARILYGGSVKPDNIRGLMAQPDIDGALVGGASLEPASFAAIVNF